MYQSDYFLFTSLQTFLHGGPIRKCLRFLRTVEMCFFRLHLIDDQHKPKLEFGIFCRNFLWAKNSKFVHLHSFVISNSNWVQKLNFTLIQVFPKVEFLDKNGRFGTVCFKERRKHEALFHTIFHLFIVKAVSKGSRISLL